MRSVLLAVLVAGCTLRGDGVSASQTRLLPYFEAVEVFNNFHAQIVVDAKLATGGKQDVTIRGDSNALGRLFAGVHAPDTLSVTVDPNHLTKLDVQPELTARVPRLVRVFAADQAQVEATGVTGELTVGVTHDAAVSIAGTDVTATIDAEDGGFVALAGDGPSLTISASDEAGVDAAGFRAGTVTVDARGTGPIVVCADGEVRVDGPGEANVERRCE